MPVMGDGCRARMESGNDGPITPGGMVSVGLCNNVDRMVDADDEGEISGGKTTMDSRRETGQPVRL